jgi:polysaccharide biosynthesis transport protein
MNEIQQIRAHPRLEDVSQKPEPQLIEEFDLRELGRVLWRRKEIILGTVILITMLAVMIVFQLTPRYTAETSVLIDPRKAQVVNMEAVLAGLSADAQTIESQIQVIRSRGLAHKTIVKLKLDRYPEFSVTQRPASFKQLLDLRNYLPDGWRAAFTPSAADAGPATFTAKEEKDRTRAQLINGFLSKLKVARVGRSRVIRISFNSQNPITAALVANTIADFYIVAQLETKFEATRRASKWLAERLTVLREQVETSEKAVESFRAKSGLIEGRGATLAAQDLSEVRSQLTQVRAKKTAAASNLREIENQLASKEGIGAISEVLRSPLIQKLRGQEIDLAQRVSRLGKDYGERHPKMINVRAELATVTSRIESEARKIIAGLRNEVAVARSGEVSLRATLDLLKREMSKFNRAEVQLRALQREANANRTLFSTFLSRFKETSSQESFQEPDASVISLADIPQGASFPKKGIMLSVAFMASLILGVLLAFASSTVWQCTRSPAISAKYELVNCPKAASSKFVSSPEKNAKSSKTAINNAAVCMTIAGNFDTPASSTSCSA